MKKFHKADRHATTLHLKGSAPFGEPTKTAI